MDKSSLQALYKHSSLATPDWNFQSGTFSNDPPERRVHALEHLFEVLPGLYVILSPDFTIVAVTDDYLKATLTTREGIIGRGMFEVFPDNPDDPCCNGPANLRISLNHVRSHGEPHTMAIQRYDIRRVDGSYEERYWSPVNSPVFDEEGRLKFIVHRAEDVTAFVKNREDPLDDHMHRMEAEIFASSQKVQEVNTQLAAANRELESFSYSVSHDLRAPLRAISGFSRVLLEDYGNLLPPDGLRHLKILNDSAARMGSLIDDLLTFSRLGRAPLSREKTDMLPIVKQLTRDLSEQSAKPVDLIVDSLPTCVGDSSLLRQVWTNLLSNAFKYTSKCEAPKIEIGFDQTLGAYFVKDNGAGFDMRYADKLFGVFQRLHRMEEYEGTGVGLANVKRIVERHEGRVWAEAEPGHGATFYFTIPSHE